MIKTRIPRKQRLILDNVSWKRYTQLLHIFSDRHLRLTYDRGRLEIMTLSFKHELFAEFLARLIFVLTEELNLPVLGGGSTTFRLRKDLRGLEPDHCFWIANAPLLRGKTKIDLANDPPPDLALEIDISRSSLNRMRIYATLRIPEVWRYADDILEFYSLGEDLNYVAIEQSPTFPITITPADIIRFVGMRDKLDDNEIIRQFRAWIRARIAAG